MFSNFCNVFINRVLNNFVIKLIDLLHLIIRELLGIPEIATLSSVAKDTYLNNRSKTTHCTQNYLLNCFIVCLLYNYFEILPTFKASGLLFIFVHVSMGHAYFSNDEICISGCLWGPVRFFSAVECLKSPLRKLALKSVDGRYAPFSTWKRNPPLSKSLTVCKSFKGFV